LGGNGSARARGLCVNHHSRVVAAYEIAPKDRAEYRSDGLGPLSLALTNFMLDAVNLLLRTDFDRSRSAWWHAMRERRDALGEHGLN
jgi:hypothetical protein